MHSLEHFVLHLVTCSALACFTRAGGDLVSHSWWRERAFVGNTPPFSPRLPPPPLPPPRPTQTGTSSLRSPLRPSSTRPQSCRSSRSWRRHICLPRPRLSKRVRVLIGARVLLGGEGKLLGAAKPCARWIFREEEWVTLKQCYEAK